MNRQNLWLAGGLLVLVGVGATMLQLTMWAAALAASLSVAGVLLFRDNRWRSGALLVAALSVGLVLLEAFAGWLAPSPISQGLVKTVVPERLLVPDPVLGYRLSPGTKFLITATFGSQTIYSVSCTVDAKGARVTPQAPANADTYLFMGDSFVFGEGLGDAQSVAAQFAQANDFRVRTLNLGVPGYGPNHLVRAFEAGLLDRFTSQSVKAVVTWIIPAQLARVTGDGPWLGSSPRYVLDNGVPRHTGSFNAYRWSHPVAGLSHLAREQFNFVKAIGAREREEEQAQLFVALIARLQDLARQRLGARLIAIYSWPDEASPPGYTTSEVDQPKLVAILDRLRHRGIPLLSVNSLITRLDLSQILIPHDGHPTALTNQLVAEELKRRLMAP